MLLRVMDTPAEPTHSTGRFMIAGADRLFRHVIHGGDGGGGTKTQLEYGV